MKRLGLVAGFCLSMSLFAFAEELMSYLDRHAVSNGEENPRLNLRAIEEWAFAYGDLTVVNIPEGITVIGRGAFANNALSSVALPKSLKTIDGWAFAHNNIASVVFPENVVFVGEYAFLENGVTDITLGEDVYVSPDAVDIGFYDCYNRASKVAGRYILKDGVWRQASEE